MIIEHAKRLASLRKKHGEITRQPKAKRTSNLKAACVATADEDFRMAKTPADRAIRALHLKLELAANH